MTFRELLENNIKNLRDPDDYVSYETYASLQNKTNNRNINNMEVLGKYLGSKNTPIRKGIPNTSAYYFELEIDTSKSKVWKLILQSPDSSRRYMKNFTISVKSRLSTLSTIDIGIEKYDEINKNILKENIKKALIKAQENYEYDQYNSYQRQGKLDFAKKYYN